MRESVALWVVLTRLAGACALLLLMLLGERSAHAEPASHYVVFLQATATTHPSLESVLEATRGPLGELGVELLVAARPSSPELGATARGAQALARSTHAVAVVWLDSAQNGASGSLVYFYDPVRSRLLSRSVAVSESETAAAEEVAVVLRSAVSALLAGADVAMTEVKVLEPPKLVPVPAEPAQPAPARATSTPKDHSPFSVGLGYVATLVAKDAGWQSGARLSAGCQPAHSPWMLAVAYQFLPSLRAQDAQVTTRLFRHPAEVALSLQLFGDALRVYPELAFVADPTLRRTERAASPLVATPESTRWLWALSTRFRARWALSKRLSAVTALGADFVLNPFQQMADEVVPQAPLYSLLRVRPLVEAGISVDLW